MGAGARRRQGREGAGALGRWGARGRRAVGARALASARTRADAQAGVARAAGGRWVGARQGAAAGAGARRARGAGLAGRWARGLGARASLGLCTRCTRPVFGPVRLGIFPSQNFWTLFVNPVHEHCSSRNFFEKKNIFLNLIKNQIKSNKF